MKQLGQFTSRERGFTLIEAMIAVVILAVGLLAIAKFQSALVSESGYNKARAEAIALAQDRIDQLRSYLNEEELLENLEPTMTATSSSVFPDDLTDGTYNQDASGNAITINGTNAQFEMEWDVAKQDAAVDVRVKVTWADPVTGEDQLVNLSTVIGWNDPRLTALAALDEDKDIYDVRGRARQGAGHYDTIPSEATDNDDGTSTYENLATGEVELIDNVTGDVLLTLEDACNAYDGTNVVCTDFVKISGQIWIDDGRITGSAISTSDLSVLASDASFCSVLRSDVIDTGDYRYFPYTCYLGGGWSGNIGLIQKQNNPEDVCVGDPWSSNYAPKVAQRRVYRGFISNDEYTGAGTSSSGADLVADDYDADGIKNYGTIGISDALQLPNPFNDTDIEATDTAPTNDTKVFNVDYNAALVDPFGRSYLPGHNFMITNLPTDPEGSDCNAALQDAEVYIELDDASANVVKTVNAFAGNPHDFLCFNQVFTYPETDINAIGFTAVEPYFDTIDFRIEEGYLLAQNDASGNSQQVVTDEEVIDASGNIAIKQVSITSYNGTNNLINVSAGAFMDMVGCPYDPSDPPSELDFLEGSIYNIDNSPQVITGAVINTSDDVTVGVPGNCTVDEDADNDGVESDGEMADFSCDIYHTYDVGAGTGTGWTGTVSITPAAADASGNELVCITTTDTNASGTDQYTYSTALTADTGTQGTKDDPDFTCANKKTAVVIKGDFNKIQSAVVVDDITIKGVKHGGNFTYTGSSNIDGSGACSFTQSEYTCIIHNYYTDTGVALEFSWTGGHAQTTVCEYDADIAPSGNTIEQVVTQTYNVGTGENDYTDANASGQDALWIGNDTSDTGWGGDDTPWTNIWPSHQVYSTVPDTYIQDITFDRSSLCPSVVLEPLPTE